MIDPQTKICDQGSRKCHKMAKAVFSESRYDYETRTNVPTVTYACGLHAAGLRRRSWGPTELDHFGDDTQRLMAERDDRERVAAEKAAVIAAEKAAAREAERRERAEREWAAVDEEWVHTLVVDVSPDPWSREGHDRVEVTVHVHRVGAEIGGWDRCEVSIAETADEPAVVKISGGSPMTITANAARALSSAVAMVAQWVDELNA